MTRTIFATAVVTLAAAAALLLASAAGAHGGDGNHDGLPDRWERQHHLSLKDKQSRRDQDGDGLNNRGEYRANFDPRDDDSDDDGIEDGDENAGTIASFTDGVLTLTLAKGGTLAATITDDTDLACDDAPAAKASGGGDDDDDDHGDGGHHHGDRHHGDEDENGNECAEDPFTASRKVKEAELTIRHGEAIWEHLELGA